jgi:hypothetical protein
LERLFSADLDSVGRAREGRRVIARLGRLVLVMAAIMAATGTHWVLFQSIAWTSMLAENLEKTSLGEALDRTFDGRHPCEICRQIETGKKSDRKSEASSPARKLEFCRMESFIRFLPPARLFVPAKASAWFDSLSSPPPVPPPRLLPG